ncbi:MAG: tryptophan 2,3-dioxygenase family protein, partial [Bacteroidota bacterium]
MALDPAIAEKIRLLEEKYAASGQDLKSYLDGLLHADYLTYWDYVHLDTLLSLQTPRTKFPDETIFIVYHQITELYFKLCRHELDQISEHPELTADFMVARLGRVNRYFEALTFSFDIMSDGMEQEQFLQYRMSLLPASGFQSAQYRMIEIGSTDFINLVEKDERKHFSNPSVDNVPEMFEWLYWKKGATELATGKKTLTLRQFEDKYAEPFMQLARKRWDNNIWARYRSLPANDQQREDLRLALRKLDVQVNINWPL